MSGFEDIYTQYAKPVYRFLLKLTGSEDQAEELLQETFYKALVHIDRFEGRCSLYTWLCQIGKNAWLKECRRKKRYSDGGVDAVNTAVGSLESAIIDKEEAFLIRQAVYRLEEPYKEVFILHTFGQLKFKEIAAVFGKTESWARVTYHRAKCRILQGRWSSICYRLCCCIPCISNWYTYYRRDSWCRIRSRTHCSGCNRNIYYLPDQ